MALSDEEVRTFGVFPVVTWSPDNHMGFPLPIRQRVMTILGMAQIHPTTKKPYHPECPFSKLPQDILIQILELVAGTRSVLTFLERSPLTHELPHVGDLVLDFPKPSRIQGFVLEMDFCAVFPASYNVIVNGMPTGILTFPPRPLGLPYTVYVPENSCPEAWVITHVCAAARLTPPADCTWRLVARPYGQSVLTIERNDGPFLPIEKSWNLGPPEVFIQCLGEACAGESTNSMGDPVDLICKPVHKLLDLNSNLNLRVRVENKDSRCGNIKLCFF